MSDESPRSLWGGLGNWRVCAGRNEKGASDDSDAPKWRRRESNEQEPLPNPLTAQQLATFKLDLSAHCQHFQDADWLNLSAIDSRLANFILLWASLSGETISQLEALCVHEFNGNRNPVGDPIVRSRLRELQLGLGEVLRSWPRINASSIPVLDEALRQLQLVTRKE